VFHGVSLSRSGSSSMNPSQGKSYIELEHARTEFPESHAHLLLDEVEFDGEPPRSLGCDVSRSAAAENEHD